MTGPPQEPPKVDGFHADEADGTESKPGSAITMAEPETAANDPPPELAAAEETQETGTEEAQAPEAGGPDEPGKDEEREPEPERLNVATNETNRKLEITSADREDLLVLAPFEERGGLSHDEVERFGLRHYGDLVRVDEEQPKPQALKWTVATTMLGLSVWPVVIWIFVGAGQHWPAWWGFGWAALALAALIAVTIDVVRSRPREALKFGLRSVHRAYGWTGRQLNLLTSLLIGLVLPTAAIFFSADMLQLIDILREKGIHQHDALLTLIGRLMQITFIAVASLLPALLFFLFDREHLATLRARFLRQIMRFDPTVRTQHDVLAKYGKVMDEAYGRDVAGRILPGRRSPLLLATLVVSLGWTLTLLHGDLILVGVKDSTIITLFEPRKSALCFAFLGAYFYGVNAMLRGYIRRDLRPKTYSTLTVRIFIVVLLAWLLELTLDGSDLYVIAFLAGIVPETVLVGIKEALKGPLLSNLPFLEEEPDPLTNLEGIDLYDRARLFDEGVTNIECLAHHDLVELMLQTRIPVARLVDWADQAVLYLHSGPQAENGRSEIRKDTVAKLREYGIRTATDLDNAFAAAKSPRELSSLVHILDANHNAKPARLQVMKETLDDDEWMLNLRAWRDQKSLALQSQRLRAPAPGGVDQRTLSATTS